MGVSRKVSATEGNWSFDIVTTDTVPQNTSIITYYSGQEDPVVIVPSALGGASVTAISAQAFGHHDEIRALYVPDSVTTIADWALYDLNTAIILSFANPNVSIAEGAFQSSGNAVLYLPEETSQTSAGGKDIITEGTEALGVTIVNQESAAIAGGQYLNVIGDYIITQEMIAAIGVSASGEASDVVFTDGTITFYGPAYEVIEQEVEIYPDFADDVEKGDLTKTFWSFTAEEAENINQAIASSSSYGALTTLLHFEEGYYINGNKVQLSDNVRAYDVRTGETISMVDGRYPSSDLDGYYKYIAYRDTDNDGMVDIIYYSPFSVTYSYNTVNIVSENENLNGLSSRDILNPLYLTFANATMEARGESGTINELSLALGTSVSGDAIGAGINQERSILWADDYGTIAVDELHAASTSFANWAKMSYVAGLSSYNVEIAMEWGMNALLYATNGGVISIGSLEGNVSDFSATGDAANGAIAGGSGTKAGTAEAISETAIVRVYNANFNLEGWNNHVADVVYGGYAYLEKVNAVTGRPGSYAVGQASALANDFGNGVVDVKDFHATVYGNRSAGIYVIGGGVATAEDSSFISKMDAGMVIASGGTLQIDGGSSTGQIALRGRGGISSNSSSIFTGVSFSVEKDISAYTTGNDAARAATAWQTASGGTALMHFMMSDPQMTIGQLCDNYNIPEDAQAPLIAELGEISGTACTRETLVRNSALDNTYYNYSAGAYTGTTDFSDVPYLTVGSAFGGLVSSIIEFEGAGVTLNLNNCSFINNNGTDYNYLVASEAGSNLVVNFTNCEASGLIWNEGSVNRAVEGAPGNRSSQVAVTFDGGTFNGSFADGGDGLWEVEGLSYTNGTGQVSSVNGNYYGATANWGASATLRNGAMWVVSHESYLGSLIIDPGASISAPNGYTPRMTVNGTITTIGEGAFSGEITITPIADEGQPEPPAGEEVPEIAEIYVENGVRAPEKEYGDENIFSITPVIDSQAVSISGVTAHTDEYSGSFFVAVGENSESNISATEINLGADSFNGDAGHAVSAGDGAFITLDGVDISVDGSLRYAAYVIEDSRMVVKNSDLRTTGAVDGDGGTEPASNAALLIYGMSRTNMSVGQSRTYYFNSNVVAEGWAALSTDSATGTGLELHAYNTTAEAENGGYATYADTDCNVYLYGSDLSSSEIGAIISTNGNIQVLSGEDIGDAIASYLGADDEKTTEGTVITGGRNAVMLHAPDMMGEGLLASRTGTLNVRNSSLITDEELASNAVTDYAEKYGNAIGAYIDHIMGSLVLLRSTSANITLNGTSMKSYSGVLVHTVINSDSMGNFLAEGDADNVSVDNVNVTMANMSVIGDMLHEDYQRYMNLALNDATLEGVVTSGTFEKWKERWGSYGDVNWLPDDVWGTTNGVYMSLSNNSTWIVTSESTLSGLTIDETSTITAPGGAAVAIMVDGTAVLARSGSSYSGKKIVISPA